MNTTALEVLRVLRRTDRLQPGSVCSHTKPALVSCLETCGESPRKTWHGATMEGAATLSHRDLEHREGSTSCRWGWERWLSFWDGNNTSFPKQLVSILWHCGLSTRWPGRSAEMEEVVGLQFFVQPRKCCKQAWPGEPSQGLGRVSMQRVQLSCSHVGLTTVSSSCGCVHLWKW